MKNFKLEKSTRLRDRVLVLSFLFVLILETLFLLMKAILNAEVVSSFIVCFYTIPMQRTIHLFLKCENTAIKLIHGFHNIYRFRLKNKSITMLNENLEWCKPKLCRESNLKKQRSQILKKAKKGNFVYRIIH